MIIVHIENNAINSMIFSKEIKKMGLDIDIIRFSEPKSFLEVMNTIEYDIIMSDVDMPIMNGIEFFSILNEMKINVPKYFITAHSNEIMIKKLESLSDGILFKPFNVQSIWLLFGVITDDNVL